jgi:hypothetical protein
MKVPMRWVNWPLIPALFRLGLMFEPLRKYPRFQRLIASTALK